MIDLANMPDLELAELVARELEREAPDGSERLAWFEDGIGPEVTTSGTSFLEQFFRELRQAWSCHSVSRPKQPRLAMMDCDTTTGRRLEEP